MSLSRPAASPLAGRMIKNQAESLLARLEGTHTMRGRVESVIRSLLAKGDVTAEAVAAELAMSRQTLFRVLRREQTTYQQVLADVRRGQYVRPSGCVPPSGGLRG